ncbi:MAG: serine/threonine-protein phosphatase [Candidatus Odyssella sp.]|nr:serine/threonine-protein phosphatase [Candidatus Odyssella sp.]
MKIERGYAQHVGSRNEQQDAGLVLTNDGRTEQLVLVADGMGGHAGGSLASAQVAETARRIWEEHKRSAIEPKRLLERIVREGHESINRAGAERGLTPRSTCALLLVRDGSAHWAHVGDSRIYRLRDGHVTRLTRDHSVVQMLVDLGKVSEEEMGTHPDQNRLTQSLGGDAVPMPDFGTDAVKEHDAFLVCSDGLWEMIPQVEMAAALSAKKLGDDGAKHLADRAFDRAKPKSDNITVALLRVGGPPPATVGADDEEARTTRILGQPPLRRSPGGAGRWAFAAATVVALGAAAAVVYKPWDKQAADTRTSPAASPKEKPAEKAPAPDEKRGEPAKPEPMKPEPAERREAVPPQRPPEPPPREAPPAPGAVPPAAPAPAPDPGSTKPGEPPATGGEPEKKQPAPRSAPPRPAQPAPAAPPRQSGLGPDEKKNADPAPNAEKPPGAPVPPAAPAPPGAAPQGPGQAPEPKPQ